MTTETLYKVLDENGHSCHGGSAVWNLPHLSKKGNPKKGKWMPEISPVIPCKSGYHIVTLEQLPKWLGPTIWVVEGRGEFVDHGDKMVYSEARIVSSTSWNERAGRLLAADCAEHVLGNWTARYPKDDRPAKAIQAARDYANGVIDSAACSAACSAADSDEKKWQSERLAYYLHEWEV